MARSRGTSGSDTQSESKMSATKHVDRVPKKKYFACGKWDSHKWHWTEHDVDKYASHSAHAVHTHKMHMKMKLPGTDRVSRSGVMTADSSFLEAWGFPLGQRDRNGKQIEKLWKKNNGCEYFRGEKSFDYLKPLEELDFKASIKGSTFGSRTNFGWTAFDHVAAREGARLACGTMNHRDRHHPYPYDNCEMRPGLIYSKNYMKNGNDVFRDHVPKTEKEMDKWGQTEILDPTQMLSV